MIDTFYRSRLFYTHYTRGPVARLQPLVSTTVHHFLSRTLPRSPVSTLSCTFPTCSGTNSPRHKSLLYCHKSSTQSSTIHRHTSCSQWDHTSLLRPPHPAPQLAAQVRSACRTFRTRPGIRHRSRCSGPGYRSWGRSDRQMSSSGKSTRWRQLLGRSRRPVRCHRRRFRARRREKWSRAMWLAWRH